MIQKATTRYVKPKKRDTFAPIPKKPLGTLHREFLDAVAFFVDTYPKNERVPEVSFLAAEQYIKNGHYREGVKRLEVIMEHHRKHRFAARATTHRGRLRIAAMTGMEQPSSVRPSICCCSSNREYRTWPRYSWAMG